jgi:hypothetical protein
MQLTLTLTRACAFNCISRSSSRDWDWQQQRHGSTPDLEDPDHEPVREPSLPYLLA